MRGSITKRGAMWTVRYDETQRTADGGSGERRVRDETRGRGFPAEQLRRIGDGSYTAPAKITVAEFLDEWLVVKESKLRPLTHESYGHTVRRQIVPALGAIRLQGLTGAHLTGFYSDLEDKYAPSTCRRVHAILHAALHDAVRWGRLVRNPADMVDPPRAGPSRARAWTASELGRFLDQVADDRLFAFWRLAATSGMRRGELGGLTWRCTDLDGARVSVEQQIVPTAGGTSFGPPKTARSRRTVALDPETVDALRRHRDAQLLERDFAGDAYSDHDLVFCDELGEPFHPNRISEWFAGHRKAAGIPAGTLHILRHTAATLMLTSGIPVHITAARLGDHPKTVLSTYAHLLPQSDELAAERVAAAIC